MTSIIAETSREIRAILEKAVIEDRDAGSFRVNRRLFVDQAILEAERRAIFDRCWLYVGHASEIAKPGAFITRNVGGRAILMNRDRSGRVNVFHNTCSHRGALVSRERSGLKRAFQCPYHGWVYDDRGILVDVPGKDAMAPGLVESGSLNLRPVPNMAEHRGFIFLNFDKQARLTLTDYLAGAADVLDIIADQGADGMEVVGGMQEYSMAANWKLLQENSADGYHAAVTHATYFDYLNSREGELPRVDPVLARGRCHDLGRGHAYTTSRGTMPWGRPYARWIPSWGEEAKAEIDQIVREMVERLGEERATLVSQADRNTLIFPNLVVNDIMAVTVRTFYPARPDYTEISAWGLAPKGESAPSRDRRMKNFVEFLGPAGFATPDDVEMLEMCQQGYSNNDAIEWNDISRGMKSDAPIKTDEAQMRAFWREWQKVMLTNNI